MNLDELHLIGTWTGKNLLRLSWLPSPDHFSSSDLSVSQVVRGKFLSFTYTWEHENIPQEGLLVIGLDVKEGTATAAWIDSWHMSVKVMSCRGTIDKQGITDLRGSYEAPPGPDWGWRIVITPSANSLQIKMYNCPPEGGEDLAVQADYKPARR